MQSTGPIRSADPKYITHVIKSTWQTALQLVRRAMTGHDEILTELFRRLNQGCDDNKACINHIHVTAIISGTAKVWTAAVSKHTLQDHTHQALCHFTLGMLKRLQPFVPQLGFREPSIVLSSLGLLGTRSDGLVPGMVDSLALQFMAHSHAAKEQDYADVMKACVDLELDPCQGELLKAISVHLRSTRYSNNMTQVVQSLSRLPTATPAASLLDGLCASFQAFYDNGEGTRHMDAKNTWMIAQALCDRKHVPTPRLASRMIENMVTNCQLPGQRSVPFTGFLLSCAKLRMSISKTDADIIVSRCLSMDTQHFNQLQCANLAWSLAVLGLLRATTLDILLDQASDTNSSHCQPSQIPLPQLYQALHWVEPSLKADAHQREVWLQLQAKLSRLGLNPPPEAQAHTRSHQLLCAALTKLDLMFKPQVNISSYWIDAVLEPNNSSLRPILLTAGHPDCFANMPTR